MSNATKWVLVAIFAALLVACGHIQMSAQSSSPATGGSADAQNSISKGDLVEVVVFESTDLSSKARVDEEGDALLPLIGKVHMEGLSLSNAAAIIRTRLMQRDFVKDPKVTVSVAEYARHGVSVLGEVKKPGIYTTMGPHRLNDYLSLAEGVTEQAGTNVAITHRSAPEAPVTVQISSRGNASAGSNPAIEPGDTIMVPKAGEIYVVGDVVRPGGYLMDHDEQLSIVQALALAQGANRTAKLKHSVIIRKTSTGRTEIPVDVDKVLSMQSKDIALIDNDILFIPVSKAKTAFGRTMEAIVQTAVGAASYRTF